MKKKKLKGNQKLRAVYGNAASALTVQTNGLNTENRKALSYLLPPRFFDLELPESGDNKKPP
jgi:hypothetical protein